MNIAVYCSAKDIIPEEYKLLGDNLGKWIAENGHALVYGGATGGLMTRTSNATHLAGGRVIGIVPTHIVKVGRKADNCDDLYLVEDMASRKKMMRSIADCFICLPGSYGTLDEMFDVIASGTIGEHRKPIYILNYKGFYDGLLQLSNHMKELHFLPQEEHYKPIFVNTLEELYESIHC